MADYMQIFRKVIADLEASADIEVVRQEVGEGMDADYVRGFLENNGFTASAEYVDFYSNVDSVDIEWVVVADAIPRLGLETNMGVSGRIYIASFENVLSDLKSPQSWFNIAWNGYVSATESHEARPFIPFDYFDPDRSGCACVDASESHIGEAISYFDHQFGAYPLGLTIDRYCRHLSRTRGMYGWQGALIGEHTEYSDQVTVALSKLFPGA